jgi:hypothetical protein
MPCTLTNLYRFDKDAYLPTGDLARESRLAGKLDDCNNDDDALDDVVALHLERLAGGQVATVDFCAAETDNAFVIRRRMHAMFGQCQTNAFRFKLNQNDSVENWLRLYAAAIRCSIQPCGRGFVFVSWVYEDNTDIKGRHATALYFDVARKTQVFIDPSGCLKYTKHGNILQHFREFHVWLPQAEKPHVSTTRTGLKPWSGPVVNTENTAVLSGPNQGAAKDSAYQRMLHHHGRAGGLDVSAFRVPGSTSNGEEHPLRNGRQAWTRVGLQ